MSETKTVLHLIPDEKITNDLIKNFSEFSDQVFCVYKALPRSYITMVGENIVHYAGESLAELKNRFAFETLVLHGANGLIYKLLFFSSVRVKNIVWIAWGADIYNVRENRPNLYFRITKKFVDSKEENGFVKKKIRFLKEVIYDYMRKSTYRKITHFASYIYEDFEYFSKDHPNNYRFVPFNFCSIDQYVPDVKRRILNDANNILVGNSISAECNHVDAFHLIKPYINEEDVHVPLNYGTDYRYRDEVLEKGNEILGNNFNAIVNFVPLNEYIDLTCTCSVGIFYHKRQQAMGNILAMLYLGCRIYLSFENPTYKYFKRNGFVVFSLENDFKQFRNQILPFEEAQKNRQLIGTLFSQEETKKGYKSIVNL